VNAHYCGRAGRKIGTPASAVDRPNLTLNVFVSVQADLAKLSVLLLTMEQQYHLNDNDMLHANIQ
jgi:hypothetical protein